METRNRTFAAMLAAAFALVLAVLPGCAVRGRARAVVYAPPPPRAHAVVVVHGGPVHHHHGRHHHHRGPRVHVHVP